MDSEIQDGIVGETRSKEFRQEITNNTAGK